MSTTSAPHHRARKLRVLAVLLLLGAVVAGAALRLRGGSNRMTVEEVAQSLSTGEITAGMKLPGSRLPKPWLADAYPEGDTVSAVYVMRGDRYTVLLYHHDWGVLFAACTIKSPPDGGEVWHFYDADLMTAHVQRVQRGR